MTVSKTPPKLVDSNQIKSTSLHVPLSFAARLYFWPFALLYATWGSAWFYLTKLNPTVLKGFLEASKAASSGVKYPFLTLGFWIQYEEFMLIPLGFLAFAHFMTVMGCSWNVNFRALVTCRRVKRFEDAELILVTPQEHRGRGELCPIKRDGSKSVIFEYQQRKFYWNSDRKIFEKPVYPDNLEFSHYYRSKGLSDEESEKVYDRFGGNEFDLPVPTFLSLFKEHIQAPFFVFQIFCVGLWCLDEYWMYSVFTLFMLVVFESTVVQQRLKTLQEFRGMSVPPVEMFVLRNSKWISIKSNEIVPGDVCAIPFSDKVDSDGLTIPCDLILLQGSCIVNEAMISGESTPLLKESIEDVDGNDLIDISDSDRNHVLFGGTKVLQIHSHETTSFTTLPDGLNCPFIIGFAARTGFGTLQGKLIRTMIYSSEHVSANNTEAFLFIGFLLIFALIAAGYVLVKGVEEEGRNRYKLLIECTLIITAVVPPELPMELSMAVNNSLQELQKFAIFCMEPFRIPLAGKLDICCFDKTGTITAENLIVEGLASLDSNEPSKILTGGFEASGDVGKFAQKVMSICHSLFLVRDGQVAGDPMEKATLEFMNWKLSANDEVSDSKSRHQIIHRFPFNSALKRMSVIAKDSNGKPFCGVKGAPEVLMNRFVTVPEWYESTFKSLALSGARVIALGYRDLPSSLVPKSFKQAQRDDFEKELNFCGFLVFRCPLKKDSKSAIRLLRSSSHRVMMITGDNALTAIYTAKEVEMISKSSSVLLFDVEEEDGEKDQKLKIVYAADGMKCSWLKELESIKGSEALEMMKSNEVSLCFTGNAYDVLARINPDLSLALLPQTAIFARTSPTQKESILARLKSPPLSLHTLMCGDGTNDVGALKQAHIGVALLDGRPEDLQKILKEMRDAQIRKHQKSILETRKRWEGSAGAPTAALDKMLENLNEAEAEGSNLVKLGDASVAAPFTSKISTIQSVCTLIRLGRSTLVTTIQMYKILALNSLIYAYNLSVLNLCGVRYGDFQMTVTGMLLSASFLFLTRGKAIKEMSAKRPQSNIFNVYLITSVLLQFALHVAVLIYVTQSALRFEIPWTVTEKLKFQPGLMNTAVYLLGLLMQVSTFVVNYQGRPFRESLMENKPLRNSLAAVGSICAIAALELFPEFNEWLELVPMPPIFKFQLISALLVDFFGCFLIEFVTHRLFFSSEAKLKNIL